MKFDKSFRGYDTTQVDNYLKAQQDHFDQVTATQKQRIFQLSDENEQLKAQLSKYQLDEKAIKDSLIESQKLAIQLKNDADKYSNLVLKRAKLFYATWQAYAKTMLNALSPQEMAQFSALMHQIEGLMQSFGEMPETEQTPSLVNPVTKLQQASQHAIDLAELLQPNQSLEEMCADLGLI